MSHATFFDSHCHLDIDAFDDEAGVDAAVARAREAGVRRMVTIGSGYGVAAANRSIAVAERHEDVWATVGIHPHDAKQWTPEGFEALLELSAHPKVVALGEMGLDFHYDNSPREEQRDVFRRQLRAAAARDLPVVIHDRSSEGETLAILEEEGAFGGAGVLFHCFTGDVERMERIVSQGGYVSIPGIVTFKNAGVMRDVARAAPLDRLMVETDSPFLTPVPHRGRRNEPAHVPLVAEAVASERGLTVEEVARATWDNASRFFSIA